MRNGRAIGMASTTFAGVRVAGQLTYVPEYTKDDKTTKARCIIPVYMNNGHSTSMFRLMAQGEMAAVCCTSLSIGKAIDAIAEPYSYQAFIFNEHGGRMKDITNRALQTTKTVFIIKNIIFGEEAVKTITAEIATGHRPMNWHDPSHPDYHTWATILKQRQKTVFNVGDRSFGYARVVLAQDIHDIQDVYVEPKSECKPSMCTKIVLMFNKLWSKFKRQKST